MMHDLTNTLLFVAGILFCIAGTIGILTALTNRRAQEDAADLANIYRPSETAVLANLFTMQSKQLMSFHKAGIMLANSEVQVAQADADKKRAEADRLRAETDNVNAQRRETEANTDVDAIPKPGAPPKFGSKGRHRVGETAYTEETSTVRTH